MEQKIIRLVELKRVTGLSSTTIYRLAKQGEFPKPIKLGLRSSGWLKAEIDKWFVERIDASREGGV